MKVSGAIAPTNNELAQVDKPAPEGEFVTEGGRKVGTKEAPVVEARMPGTEKKIAHEPKDGTTVVKGEGEPETDVTELAQTTKEQKDRLKEGVLGQAKETRSEDLDVGRVEGATKDVVGDERVELAKQGAEEIRQRATEAGEREMTAQDEKEAQVQRKVGGIMGRLRGAKVSRFSPCIVKTIDAGEF